MVIESDQIEKILNEHGEKLEEHTEQIHELQKTTALNSQMLKSIENNQTNIEKTLRKNNELYLANQNNVIAVMERNTNGILTMSKQFIDYMSNNKKLDVESNKDNLESDVQKTKSLTTREIFIAIFGTGGIAYGLIQAFVK